MAALRKAKEDKMKNPQRVRTMGLVPYFIPICVVLDTFRACVINSIDLTFDFFFGAHPIKHISEYICMLKLKTNTRFVILKQNVWSDDHDHLLAFVSINISHLR